MGIFKSKFAPFPVPHVETKGMIKEVIEFEGTIDVFVKKVYNVAETRLRKFRRFNNMVDRWIFDKAMTDVIMIRQQMGSDQKFDNVCSFSTLWTKYCSVVQHDYLADWSTRFNTVRLL